MFWLKVLSLILIYRQGEHPWKAMKRIKIILITKRADSLLTKDPIALAKRETGCSSNV
jgi:hypothetical protein